jgi:hypothetical protein
MNQFEHIYSVPLMTRAAFAIALGLPLGVFTKQCERGYWPEITIGKRVFINVEAVRVLAAKKALEFTL